MWPDDERPRAEETLARQAQLLANVREAVIATDSAGLITCWNDGATRVFGWTVEDMLGRPFWERYPENLRDRVDEILGAVASGSDWSAVREDRRKDGTQIWIDVVVESSHRSGRYARRRPHFWPRTSPGVGTPRKERGVYKMI